MIISKKILILYIVFFGFISESHADKTYPTIINESELFEGGYLIPSEKGYYLIKQAWAGSGEVINYWSDSNLSNTSGSSLNGLAIVACTPYKGKILGLLSDRSTYFLSLIDSNLRIDNIEVLSIKDNDYIEHDMKFIANRGSEFLLLFDDELYFLTINDNHINIKRISYGVEWAGFTKNSIKYLKQADGWGSIYEHHQSGDRLITRVQVADKSIVYFSNSFSLVVTTTANKSESFYNYINDEMGVVTESWTTAPIELTVGMNYKNVDLLFCVEYSSGNYKLRKIEFSENGRTNEKVIDLPESLAGPINISSENEKVICLFQTGIYITSTELTPLAFDLGNYDKLFSTNPRVFVNGNELIISTFKNSYILEIEGNSLWFVYDFITETGKLIVPIVLLLILGYFIQLYRHQKRLMHAVLNLSTSGVVFQIDRNGKLIHSNESGKKLLGISEIIPLKKPFSFYSVSEETKIFKVLVERALSNRDSFVQKITTGEAGSREWYCTIVILKNLAGIFRGFVLTAVDITEELEKRRLSNWAQLAHDMQTNLSTIRLNSEQMDLSDEDPNFIRKQKILHQVNLLIKRVRDIVTVGRSDKLELQTVNSNMICQEARAEFDDTLFPKVEFELQLSSFSMECDKPKLVRAVRNAIENSIKAFDGASGKIIISCSEDDRNAIITIKDNGPGMNSDVREKFLTPYFTTGKSKGGSGIGTMIMQHVIDLHGGKILIQSEKGLGTNIQFLIPLVSNRKSEKWKK